jgi:putative endonuclease
VRQYYVYVMTNATRTLYVGVTNDLVRRVAEHRSGAMSGFTRKYHVGWLAYYEVTEDVNAAIAREKQIKGWTRAKKQALVETLNPGWRDLSVDIGIDLHTSTS